MIGRKLRAAARLTLRDWGYLALATHDLSIARVRLAVVPSAALLESLCSGGPGRRAPVPLDAATRSRLERLSWALAVAARHVPWRSDCLVQAIAADRRLRRRRLKPDFFLGVAKDEAGSFRAHAWQRCGGVTVTGGWSDEFSVLLTSQPPVQDAS